MLTEVLKNADNKSITRLGVKYDYHKFLSFIFESLNIRTKKKCQFDVGIQLIIY